MSDITSLVALQKWLSVQEVRAARVLAARSALRALPIFGVDLHQSVKVFPENWEKLTLQLFRANFISWSCGQFDLLGDKLRTRALDANKEMLLDLPAIPGRNFQQAVFVASHALRATSVFGEDAISAAEFATRTISPGTFAITFRRAGFLGDSQALINGQPAIELLNSPLWLTKHTKALSSAWKQLEASLEYLGHDWDIWTDWYSARVAGRRANRQLIELWLETPDEIWSAEPGILNSYLKQLSLSTAVPAAALKEPEPEPGPEFDITSSGLSLKSSHRTNERVNVRNQRILHDRLKAASSALVKATRNVGNAYPGLEIITSEYHDLIDNSFDEIDVIALWAVGAGLLANRDAFSRTQDARLITSPLEPAHLALLQQTAELHGGFILGFPDARELSERADHARLSGEAMERVVSIARSRIESIRNSGRQVEEKTRKFLSSIEEGLVEPGWRITRAGYAAYVVTRNALIAIGKLLSWANSAFATIAGGLLLSEIDPGLTHTRFWIDFALKNSQQILAFSEPFPELRVWMAAQIDAAHHDSLISR